MKIRWKENLHSLGSHDIKVKQILSTSDASYVHVCTYKNRRWREESRREKNGKRRRAKRKGRKRREGEEGREERGNGSWYSLGLNSSHHPVSENA